MKNMIKKSLSFTMLMAASVLSFTSCEDWTEVEPVDIVTPQMNDQLKADYIENLKQYKMSDHKLMIVSFENKTERPSNQSEHLTVLPDSIDVVSMNNPKAVNEVIEQEMTSIREKGTKIVYNVDYSVIEKDWNQKVKEDESASLTEEDALAYITKCTKEQLALCDEFGYDGITFTFMGRSAVSMTEPMKAQYAARLNNFVEPIAAWRSAHAGMWFSFIGNPQYLTMDQKALLADCDYIILPTDMVNDMDELSVKAFAAIGTGVCPLDRIVVMAQTVRPDDDKQIYGYFGTYDENGERMRSIYGSAVWCSKESAHFTRRGLMIRNAELDYFDNTLVYGNIREAINIMNPSSKN